MFGGSPHKMASPEDILGKPFAGSEQGYRKLCYILDF